MASSAYNTTRSYTLAKGYPLARGYSPAGAALCCLVMSTGSRFPNTTRGLKKRDVQARFDAHPIRCNATGLADRCVPRHDLYNATRTHVHHHGFDCFSARNVTGARGIRSVRNATLARKGHIPPFSGREYTDCDVLASRSARVQHRSDFISVAGLRDEGRTFSFVDSVKVRQPADRYCFSVTPEIEEKLLRQKIRIVGKCPRGLTTELIVQSVIDGWRSGKRAASPLDSYFDICLTGNLSQIVIYCDDRSFFEAHGKKGVDSTSLLEIRGYYSKSNKTISVNLSKFLREIRYKYDKEDLIIYFSDILRHELGHCSEFQKHFIESEHIFPLEFPYSSLKDQKRYHRALGLCRSGLDRIYQILLKDGPDALTPDIRKNISEVYKRVLLREDMPPATNPKAASDLTETVGIKHRLINHHLCEVKFLEATQNYSKIEIIDPFLKFQIFYDHYLYFLNITSLSEAESLTYLQECVPGGLLELVCPGITSFEKYTTHKYDKLARRTYHDPHSRHKLSSELRREIEGAMQDYEEERRSGRVPVSV